MCATIIPKGVRRDMYIKRDIEKILLEAAESFQVITIYGSRQVGKSTTVDQLFGDSFETVTLDDAEELDMALSNPRAFFESHPWPLIIDEVQKAVNTSYENNSKNETVYIVKSGDTLSGIAAKYGTTYQKIARDNNIANPNIIHPGQRLRIIK